MLFSNLTLRSLWESFQRPTRWEYIHCVWALDCLRVHCLPAVVTLSICSNSDHLQAVLFQLWFFSYSCSYSYDFSVSVQVSVIILFQLLFQFFLFFSYSYSYVILNQYKFYEHTRNSVPLQVYNGSYHQYVFEISTYKSTKLHVTSFIVQCQSVTGTHCSHYSIHTSDTVTRSTCGCILEKHAFPDP